MNHSIKIKYIVITIALISLFLLFYPKLFSSKKETNFIVSASFGGIYNDSISENVFIVGKLHNTTNDTLSFLSMSCSWDDLWSISSKNLKLKKNLCFTNVPFLIKLGPNESILHYLPVQLLKPYEEIKNEKFTVGYNLIKSKNAEFSSSLKKITTTHNQFWSDTLQLSQLQRLNTIQKEK